MINKIILFYITTMVSFVFLPESSIATNKVSTTESAAEYMCRDSTVLKYNNSMQRITKIAEEKVELDKQFATLLKEAKLPNGIKEVDIQYMTPDQKDRFNSLSRRSELLDSLHGAELIYQSRLDSACKMLAAIEWQHEKLIYHVKNNLKIDQEKHSKEIKEELSNKNTPIEITLGVLYMDAVRNMKEKVGDKSIMQCNCRETLGESDCKAIEKIMTYDTGKTDK